MFLNLCKQISQSTVSQTAFFKTALPFVKKNGFLNILCRCGYPPDIATRVLYTSHTVTMGASVGFHQCSSASLQGLRECRVGILDIEMNLRHVDRIVVGAFIHHNNGVADT